MAGLNVAVLQQTLHELDLDGWLLFDFHGVNPIALTALGLEGHLFTRRFCFLVPTTGEPAALVHAVELGALPPELPGRRVAYASWPQFRSALESLLAPLTRRKLAMEYFPEGALPMLSRVDGGTLELVRALGVEVTPSAELVQRFSCRWTPHQIASHVRAVRLLDDIKDDAFTQIGVALRRGVEVTELAIQKFLLDAFAKAHLVCDHPPIVAVNGHAADPHYAPSTTDPTPLHKGDLVLIDLWARGQGPTDVYGDITWVGFCGAAPPPRAQEIFHVAASARDVGLEALKSAHRAGRTLQGWQIDRVVRGHIAAHGFGERFVHRTGHSIGRRVHGDGANLDDFETHDTRALVEGLAFSIEPGIYLPEEKLGVRTEIDVVLTPEGPQVFSKLQREIVPIAC